MRPSACPVQGPVWRNARYRPATAPLQTRYTSAAPSAANDRQFSSLPRSDRGPQHQVGALDSGGGAVLVVPRGPVVGVAAGRSAGSGATSAKRESDGPVGPSVPDGALTSSRDVAHFALPHVAPWASPIPRCRPRRARRPRRDSPRVRRGGNGVSARRGWQPRYCRRTRGGRGAAAKGRGNQRQGFRCGEGHPVPIMRFPPAGVVLR